MKVSFGKVLKDPKVGTMEMSLIVNIIKKNSKIKSLISKCRKIEDKKERQKFKFFNFFYVEANIIWIYIVT